MSILQMVGGYTVSFQCYHKLKTLSKNGHIIKFSNSVLYLRELEPTRIEIIKMLRKLTKLIVFKQYCQWLQY